MTNIDWIAVAVASILVFAVLPVLPILYIDKKQENARFSSDHFATAQRYDEIGQVMYIGWFVFGIPLSVLMVLVSLGNMFIW